MHIHYPKIRRLGTNETEGILNGECIVQEKIDGANASVWLEDGKVCIGSRTQIVCYKGDIINPFNGLCEYVMAHEGINTYLKSFPTDRLFGEWLCLSGDTTIRLSSGGKRGCNQTLKEMYDYQQDNVLELSKHRKKDGNYSTSVRENWRKRNGYPQAYSLFIDEDKIKPQRIVKIIKSGIKDVYELKTRNGFSIKSTKEHKFFTNNGWKTLGDISIGDVVATTRFTNLKEKREYGTGSRNIINKFKSLRDNGKCNICGIKNSLEVHHKDMNWKNNEDSNLVVLCSECHRKQHNGITASNKTFPYDFDKVISIDYFGEEECYDLCMGAEENSSSFVANGFIVHNCQHTVKYAPQYYKHFWLFDILEGGDAENPVFMNPVDVSEYAKQYGINHPVTYGVFENPTIEFLMEFFHKPNLGDKIEGVVIKNTKFINKYGRPQYAKLVSEKFREENKIIFGNTTKYDELELRWAVKYTTPGRFLKLVHKLEQDKGVDFNEKNIAEIIGRMCYDVITEEIASIVHNEIVNFGMLRKNITNITRTMALGYITEGERSNVLIYNNN